MVGGRVGVVVGPDCARHSTGWLGDFDLALPPTSTLTWLQGLCFDFALPLALSLTLGSLLVLALPWGVAGRRRPFAKLQLLHFPWHLTLLFDLLLLDLVFRF